MLFNAPYTIDSSKDMPTQSSGHTNWRISLRASTVAVPLEGRSMVNRLVLTLLLSALCVSTSLALAADDDIVTQLPAPAEDIAVAQSGQTLVLKLRDQKGLSLYDTKTQKLRLLELPTANFTFGAGGDTALVFLKESNELRSYSLSSLAQVKAKEFTDIINLIDIMRIVMGHSRGDLAFVRIARDTDALSPTTNHLLDVGSLMVIKPKSQQGQFGKNFSYRDIAHYRANGDMSRITEWATSHTPSGIYLYTQTEDGYRLQGNHSSAGHLAIGDDGHIYTGFGNVMDLVSRAEGSFTDPIGSIGQVEGSSLFPGIGGQFFLGLQLDGSLSVYQSGETTAMCLLEPFPDWAPPHPPEKLPRPKQRQKQSPGMLEQWIQSTLTLDKRIVFVPAAGQLIFLSTTNNRLIQRRFDLKDALDKTGQDYLLVLSSPTLRLKAGAQWDYQVAPLAKHGPVTFQLDQSPEGMSISPAGALAWKVPGGIQGRAQVVITVMDSKANVIRHRFTLEFE